MNKMTMVLGVAAVATLAGCKDPDYNHAQTSSVQNEPMQVQNAEVTPDVQPAPVEPVKEIQPAPTPAPKPAAQPAPAVPAPQPEYTVYVVQSGDYLAKISKKFNVTISSIKRLNNLKSDTVRVGQKLKLPGNFDVGVQNAPAAEKKPSAKAVRKAYAPYTGATKEYVVKNGDSLGKIAYGNGINIRQLKELNGLSKDTVRVGQKLKVPAGKDAAVAKAPAVKSSPAVAEKKPAVAEKKAAAPAPAVEPAPAPAAVAAPAAPAPVAEEKAPEAAQPAAEEKAPEAAAESESTYVVQEGEDISAVAIKWGVSAAEIRNLNNLGDNDQLKAGQAIKLPAEAQQQ